ncbi:MAG: glycosyltransferase family 2 protein [Candidatus Omnitrophica bacterium]|nr:glycosyltransferase family 2 protein [Candidatus Omnitrophota bacterium]
MKKKILIAIPAYNEEFNIVKTIDDVASSGVEADILVINDGSQDQTAKAAVAKGVLVVSLPYNLGIGGAVQTGFCYAFRNQYDIVVQVDGDYQHDAAYLKDLLAPVHNDEADMTIGSRFLPPFLGYQSSFFRRIGINFFATLISVLTGQTVTDPTSGFRAFNRKLIKVFARYYPHDFPEPEAIMEAKRYQARIKEVPVQMRERLSGHSSIRYFKTLYYMFKVTLAILLAKLKQRKDLV